MNKKADLNSKKILFAVFSAALIAAGFLLCAYDVLLSFLSPGTLGQIIFSPSNIWFILGGYLIFVGIYRFKTRKSFWQKFSKWLKICVLSICTLIILGSAVILSFICTPDTVFHENFAPDYIILLGGGINRDGSLPPSMLNRIELTESYWKSLEKNRSDVSELPKIVVTGGTVMFANFEESAAIKETLVKSGIPSEFIYTESSAQDTIQNFIFSMELLCSLDGKTQDEILNSNIAVVTSYFHLNRAEFIAKRLGFTNISGIGAKISPVYVPANYGREILAYIKLGLRLILTGKPAHL